MKIRPHGLTGLGSGIFITSLFVQCLGLQGSRNPKYYQTKWLFSGFVPLRLPGWGFWQGEYSCQFFQANCWKCPWGYRYYILGSVSPRGIFLKNPFWGCFKVKAIWGNFQPLIPIFWPNTACGTYIVGGLRKILSLCEAEGLTPWSVSNFDISSILIFQ